MTDRLAYFTQFDLVEKFGGGEGRQLADWMVKQRYGSLYRAYGFPSSEMLDIAGAWRYIKTTSIEKPVKSDKILERLAYARINGKTIKLFSPWGPRYKNKSPKIQNSDPEIVTLQEMKLISDTFRYIGIPCEVLIMQADVYGIEINGLPEDFVYSYFSYLEKTARKEIGEGVDVKLWSSIRGKNWEQYKQLTESLADVNLKREREFERAVMVAKRFNPSNPLQSAKRYVTERMAEATIIDSVFQPIKMSLVRKEKDELDGPLPRIYLVKNRAPWLAGG